MRRLVRFAILAATTTVLTLTPRTPAATRGAEACGPYALTFAFARLTAPEDPEAYLAGQIGLFQPTFRLPWLVTAYRHLSGHPLTPGERKALWDPAPPAAPAPSAAIVLHGVQRWAKARSEGLKEPEQYRYIDNAAFDSATGAYYENCTGDAFETAARTLAERIARLGADDPAIRSWIDAQDLVFANCGHEKGATASIPAALDEASPAPARADREYQIAAAHFYAGHFDEAATRFRAIGADRTSPWQPFGEYLAARALLRKGTVGSTGDASTAALAEAGAAFDRIAHDPALAARRDSAAGLKRFIDLRLRPESLRPEILGRLLVESSGSTLEEDLAEYRYLYLRDAPAEDAVMATRANPDPLTDWIDTLRAGSPEALGHAVRRWRETGNTAWLVAALMRVPHNHPYEAALVDGASKVATTSPAYPTLAFHRARLLIRELRLDEARTVTAQMAAASKTWPPGAVNAVRALQLRLATTFDAWLTAAVRTPVGFASDDIEDAGTPGRSAVPDIAPDAIEAINERLPLARLVEAVHHPALAARLQRNFLTAALTRALIIGDVDTVRRLDPDVRRAYPELAPELDAWEKVTAPDERLFATTAMLLRYPGLRPFVTMGQRRATADWSTQPPTWTDESLTELDGLRDNWWCAIARSPVASNGTQVYGAYQPGLYARAGERMDRTVAALYDEPGVVLGPAFLTDAERAQATAEWTRLDAIDAAPDYFGAEVIDWAALHPGDPRLPEALHRVVRATRLGCTTDATGNVSRDAFTLLHKKFPKSEWAKKTPYWFRD
jgi:hypothetical protein